MSRPSEAGSAPAAPARAATVSARVLKRSGADWTTELDDLAVEEPLEMAARSRGERIQLGVTLRTPGDDRNLVAGFLFSEGIVRHGSQILSLKGETESDATLPASRMLASLADDAALDAERARRLFPISAACGACGKSALEALKVFRSEPFPLGAARVSASTLESLPRALGERQSAFATTGGLHAAARFDARGTLLDAAEDVGRHNSMDKLIGAALLGEDLDWSEQVVLLSGRVGFDLIQKALVVGCPFLASIGAPSSLAVELANLFRVTLVGFLRDGRFNVYSAPDRIAY